MQQPTDQRPVYRSTFCCLMVRCSSCGFNMPVKGYLIFEHFYASGNYARRRLMFLLCPVVPVFHSLCTNTEWISMNRWTDYILGEIAPETTEQDTTEHSNRRQIGAATQRMTLHISQCIQHAASAVLASPLHTCTGGGIIWRRAVSSSVIIWKQNISTCGGGATEGGMKQQN